MIGACPREWDMLGAIVNQGGFMFRTVITAAALALAALSGSAQAQDRVQSGSLTCDVSAGIGLIIGSQRNVSCTFTPSTPGPDRVLHRHDLQARPRHRRDHRRRDGVARVRPDQPPGRRARRATTRAPSAEASVVAGIGANALVGGSNRTVALQPFSVQGQVGLNLAAGVAGLDLRWVR